MQKTHFNKLIFITHIVKNFDSNTIVRTCLTWYTKKTQKRNESKNMLPNDSSTCDYYYSFLLNKNPSSTRNQMTNLYG